MGYRVSSREDFTDPYCEVLENVNFISNCHNYRCITQWKFLKIICHLKCYNVIGILVSSTTVLPRRWKTARLRLRRGCCQRVVSPTSRRRMKPRRQNEGLNHIQLFHVTDPPSCNSATPPSDAERWVRFWVWDGLFMPSYPKLSLRWETAICVSKSVFSAKQGGRSTSSHTNTSQQLRKRPSHRSCPQRSDQVSPILESEESHERYNERSPDQVEVTAHCDRRFDKHRI